MIWPGWIIVATKIAGVLETKNFVNPTIQPIWTVINDGLPATDVRQSALDPFTPATKQYLILNTLNELYRRDNSGNWISILSTAQARTATGRAAGVIKRFWPDPSIAGRLWVQFTNNSGARPHYCYALYSDDYGANWTVVTKLVEATVSDLGGTGGVRAYGDNVFVSQIRADGQFIYCSTDKGSTWTPVGTGQYSNINLNTLQTDRVYCGGAGTAGAGRVHKITIAGNTNLVEGVTPNRGDAFWFSSTDADHQRLVSLNDDKLYVTTDSWVTKNSPSSITPAPECLAAWAGADEDQIIIGLILHAAHDGSHQPDVIGCLYGEADTTAAVIAGSMTDTAPYTDSIPETCGGAAIGGIMPVDYTPPVPPPLPDYPIPPGCGQIANDALYFIDVADPQGNRIAQLDSFLSLTYTRTVNGVNRLIMDLDPNIDRSMFKIDGRLSVYRMAASGALSLDTETIWFIRVTREITLSSGEKRFVVIADNALYLLQGRIVAYAAGEAESDKSGLADDMIKAIVRENLGALATDTLRDLSAYLDIAADLGQGPSVDKAFSWRKILPVLQEISGQTYELLSPVYFDITSPVYGTLQFQTYVGQRGTDRSRASNNPLILSEEIGNISNAEYEENYENEENYIYAGGQGEGLGREIEEVSDDARIALTPFNRKEGFRDSRQGATGASLEAEGYSQLYEGRPRMKFSCKLIDSDAIRYGRDWFWGDKVVVQYSGKEFECLITTVAVQVSGGEEKITAQLSTEGVL